MATIKGTAGNDSWTVINPGTFIIDGLGGVDTLNLGTSLRSSYFITQTADGAVHVDSVSSVSGGEFHGTLFNFEKLVFDNGKDHVDIATFFIDTTPPVVVNFNPGLQTSNASVDGNILLTFNEPIIKGLGSINLKTNDGTLIASYAAASSGNLIFSGYTLAINPSANLQFLQSYTIEISSGSVIDLKGNSYAGTNNYTFSTAPPTGIIGTSGNDNLIGTSGNDNMSGVAGDDKINGGDGRDTSFYSGNRVSYIVAAKGSDFTVQDLTGKDGTDSLTQVERLQFADGSAVALDIHGIAGDAFRIYQAAFDRKPDLTGLGYWIKDMDKGSSLTQVAGGFMQSPEFKKLYGDNPDNSTLITNFYHNVLHRVPDQAGFDYWLGQLNHNDITPAGALASFSTSAENQALVIGSIQNGIEYMPWLG